ncbi:MAG TPA: ABC transporter substrate-binding protein [Mycobacteriales bacterium]|nr:ABC transporter substrate-binding protein [Mycobacteriales bacterium]
MACSVSRKQFLTWGAVAFGGTAMSGCSAFSLQPDSDVSANSGPKGKEAPELAALVKSGDLPPVEKRLPDRPLVIAAVDRIGQYGGTWRTVLESTDPSWLWMTVRNDQLVAWDPTWHKLIPNVAESYQIKGNGREYEFTLRRGLKWSDGAPFTADDLMFWYEKVLHNKELTPEISPTLISDGKPVIVRKVDDFTVRFLFASPNSQLLQNIAVHIPPFDLMPAHYLKKFHQDFNHDLGGGWADTFLQKADPLNNVDLPVLSPWIAQNPHGEGDRQVWQRNPYYFKVDAEGSQLPYIDRVVFSFFQDPGPLLLQGANGDIDLYMRAAVTIPANKPVLYDGQEHGHYKLIDVREPDQNTMGLCLNLNHKDPQKRRLYQTKEFRIGLSHGIDRQQIIDLMYQRQGRPWQTGLRPEVPFYDSEDIGTQYTEFDLDRAEHHLTRAGVGKRGKHGRRLGLDGKPIVVDVLVPTRYPVFVDTLELVKTTWGKLGIELRISNASAELVSTRLTANQFDATVDTGELGYLGMLSDPRWLFATSGSSYAMLWSQWYQGGKPSEKPPPAMLRQMDLYRSQVMGQANLKKQYAAMKEIIHIARDEFWTMGISLPSGAFAIVSDRIQNVPGPDKMWLSFKCPYPAVTNPCQYFIEE